MASELCREDANAPGKCRKLPNNLSPVPHLSCMSAPCSNWGVLTYTSTEPDDYMGKCVQCQLIPQENGFCPYGSRLSRQEVWDVAPASDCAWSNSGCLDQPCPSGSVQRQTASCGLIGVQRECCPLKPHYLCCKVRTTCSFQQVGAAMHVVEIHTILKLCLA